MINYYAKVQNNFIKNYLKDKVKQLYWCDTEDAVYFTEDGHAAYKIMKREWCIDIKCFERISSKSDSLLKIFKECETDEYKPAKLTGSRVCENKRYHVIENDGITCYVDEKVLKDFPKCAFFKIKDNVSPVLVMDCDTEIRLGIVMPCRIKRG